MKFLIAGLGSVGRRHLRNLIALGERDIILYRTRKSTLPEDELGDFPTETELEAALAYHPDAAIISTPTALHLDVAIPAAASGCHLFLEKPISHNLHQLDELKTALNEGGGQVLVGFQFRFHPGLQQVHRWLLEGAIGRPVSARAHWGEYLPGWHPWEDYRLSYSARPDLGGGVLLTLCHPFDYLRWLLGEVNCVRGLTGIFGDLGLQVEDTAEVILSFMAGSIGSVHLDYYQQPPVHRLEIVGTQGSIQWDNADGMARLFRSNEKTWQAFSPPVGFERNHMFLDEMRHFLAVIRGETQPICSLFDGQRALEVALAVHAASQTGCSVDL
jgi:predicted dehydrogenase